MVKLSSTVEESRIATQHQILSATDQHDITASPWPDIRLNPARHSRLPRGVALHSTYQREHPQRILLIEHDEGLRRSRTKRLMSLGYRVAALAGGEAPPHDLPPHLYDVIVVNAQRSYPVTLHFSERIYPAGPRPLIVVLASSTFQIDAPSLPTVVISEPTAAAAEEKLLAVLRSVAPAKPAKVAQA